MTQKNSEGQSRSFFWSRSDGQLHLQWYRADSMSTYPLHHHAEFNIVINLRGAVETKQLGGMETVTAGEAMMGSHPGVEHSSRYLVDNQGCEAVSLTFSNEILRQFAPSFTGPKQAVFLGKIQSSRVYEAAQDAVWELTVKDRGYELVLEGLANRILVETLRAWPRQQIEWTRVEIPPCLSRRDHVHALEFMQWCRKEEFRIQRLCRFLGTSEEKFTRLFRATTGDSPASFYSRFLLNRSTSLLVSNAPSIKEVGYALGFKTTSHFVAAFRRQFGVTPMQFRRQLQCRR